MRKKTKTLFGVGVNDANYFVEPRVNGKREVCPYYRKWKLMLERAYSDKYHIKKPTYRECVVCEDWHSFMSFRKWMMKQDWVGKELDKDILYPKNKLYSPKTCCFVPRFLNSSMGYAHTKKELPLGVFYRKDNNRFRVIMYKDGKNLNLGHYDNPLEASQVYLIAKIEHIKSFYPYVNNRIRKGLGRHIKLLKANLI